MDDGIIKKIGIYGVHNTTLDKWYIGSSINVEARIGWHKNSKERRVGIFENINNDDNISYEILKEVNNIDSLEIWENYYIGFYNSINNGYNKILSSRKPSIEIKLYEYCASEVIIMDDSDLFSFLKINNQEDCLAIKGKVPHIIISKNTKRYDKRAIINFLMKESALNEYSELLENKPSNGEKQQ